MQDKVNVLQISQLQLKNFRCFDQTLIEFDSPIMLIEGINGTGKTSLLEALYYACYLRSFRTHLPRELIQFGHNNFFIKVYLQNQSLDHEVQVGFSQGKRLVKVDQKSIYSYKELLDYYRIISLTEDDIQLIKSSPQMRRTFIDQAILLLEPIFIESIRELRQVVNNRNSLLRSGKITYDAYLVWTEQLWNKSRIIQEKRNTILKEIEKETNALLHEYIDSEISIKLSYTIKSIKEGHNFDHFITNNVKLYENELRFGRSLFGAHLDDIIINFQGKKSKSFSSRGQQKLVILLVKIAQIKLLSKKKGPAIFLLDDFMTDFDDNRAQKLLSLLTALDNQLIFTSPTVEGDLSNRLAAYGAQKTKLTY